MQLYILRVGCTELTSHNYQLSIQEFIMEAGGAGAHSAWGESSVWFMPCRAAPHLSVQVIKYDAPRTFIVNH